MLSIKKIYLWIFAYMLVSQILAPNLVKFCDELGALAMACVIFLDIVVNRQYKKYKLVYIMAGIMTFYALYSHFALDYNIGKAIAMDWVLEQKPYLPLFFAIAVAPRFSMAERTVLKVLCVTLTAIIFVAFVTGTTRELMTHVTYYGSCCYIYALVYFMCSIDEQKDCVSRNDLIAALVIFTLGLLCTRSKYYGEYIITIFMLFIYKPGMFNSLKPKHIVLIVCLMAIVGLASWQKFSYYFLSGIEDEIDMKNIEATMQTFARPALYAGFGMLIMAHPVFGTGLASFASYPSSPEIHYSAAYAEVGLDKVWGLNEVNPAFINDAYYPCMAQFGLVGIAIFIVLSVWVYKQLIIVRNAGGKKIFIVGILCMVYLAIQNTTGSSFVAWDGMVVMMILGSIVGRAKNINNELTTNETN